MRHHADAYLTSVLLTSIQLRNFRNLADARWQPGHGSQLLLGPNGAGKTSLLEAVYLLATTRSFRTARIDECCSRHAEEFSLSGVVEAERRADLALGWSREGRWRRVNDKPATAAGYLGVLPVVSWSSGDLKVVDGAPRDRRRFLDQGVVTRKPAAVEILSRCRRALEQKRELLRDGLAHGTGDLSAWNEVFAEASADLMARRAEFIEALERHIEEIVGDSSLAVPEIRLRYRPSPPLEQPGREELFEVFESLRDREIGERRIVSGPHRDDVEIIWNGIDVSRIASAGEKKILGVLLCAARSRMLTALGRLPIVLLDDVDAELDRNRLEAAWELFGDAPQVIASSCHETIVESLPDAKIWRLEDGFVTAA